MLRHLSILGRDLARGFLQILYPGVCASCGRCLPPDQAGFCPPCRTALTTDPHPACPRCGSTVGPFVPINDGCSRCRNVRFSFERVLRLGPYDGLLRDAILRLKHHSGEGLAEALGTLWAEYARPRLLELGASLVIPVPLHWWRRWRRGYNQSEVLAHAVARALDLPCQPGWLRRIRNTPQQTQQSPAGRRDNVRGAFRARPRRPLRGQAVLLVDDVLTTGSTCSEAGQALLEAGANRVVIAVLAHSQG